MPADPEGRCKHMVGEFTSPTNTKKGRAEKRKINIQTVQGCVDCG